MQETSPVKKKLQPIKAKAFYLLAKKSYFSKELERKLQGIGYPAKEITLLLKELQHEGWLNDAELASRFVERQKAKGYGPRMIALKLREKAGPMDIPIEESKDAARAFIEKKYRRDLPEKREKVIAALLRRGFSYDLIKTLLEDIT